jgi:hypothetical protein
LDRIFAYLLCDCILGHFLGISRSSPNFGATFSHGFNATKNGLYIFWAILSSNSSGHPVSRSRFPTNHVDDQAFATKKKQEQAFALRLSEACSL